MMERQEIEELREKVLQFNLLKLPGQPMCMHMGTSYLVNDLWSRVQQLEREKADLQQEYDSLVEIYDATSEEWKGRQAELEKRRHCICVDYLNGNPDPVPNPDCLIHGTLRKPSRA